MKYPNAANGVKKIFTAEILTLIAGLCSFVGAVLMLVALISGTSAAETSSDAAAASAIITGVVSTPFIIAAAVLGIIAFILNIVGIGKASKDEPAFKIAFYAVFANIVIAVISAIFSGNSFVVSLMQTLSSVATLMVTLYVIQGIRNLSLRLNDHEMDEKGRTLFMIILVVLLIEFAASMTATIFHAFAGSVVAAVLLLIATVLSLVQYILYLSYLAKAKKMLETN